MPSLRSDPHNFSVPWHCRSLGSSNTAAKRTPSSARRLTYNTPQTHQHNASSFYSQPRGSRPALHQLSMNEVFVPESPEHNTQPGQQLPLPPPHPWQCSEQDHSSTSDAGGELYTVLKSMQSSIESGFQDIKGRSLSLRVIAWRKWRRNTNSTTCCRYLLHPLLRAAALVREGVSGTALHNFRFVIVYLFSWAKYNTYCFV